MTDARPSRHEAPFGFCVGLVPDVRPALDAFVAALWNPAGAVPPRAKEIVFLRTSIVNHCAT